VNVPLNIDELMARDGEEQLRQHQLERAYEMMVRSRDSLMDFARYMRPDVDHPDDADKSTYISTPPHVLLADALEKVETGEIKRLIITYPPRHGKTELAAKTFTPWLIGRHPEWHTITTTYSQVFSEEHGRAVRTLLQSPQFRNVFPAVELKKGSASASRLETTMGGIHSFVGRAGSLTGRGAHCVILDDPLKDRKEADSRTIRNQLWTWFTQVVLTRLMTEEGRVVLIATRWHEDDLTGRIIDPKNSCYIRSEAKQWTHLHLKALADEDDPLKRDDGEALWPERFGRKYLKRMKAQDARGFSALFQGEPSPDEGLFFTPEDIIEYQDMKMVPEDLRYYVVSDHAVSQEQWADKNVFMPFGLDQNGEIWIMPDTTHHKLNSAMAVELMLVLIKKYKPLFWWAERGHISKAIGPFLKKRMLEEQIFCAINELTPVADKQTRAQSIKGRMAMGRVHFPAWTNWYADCRHQILSFPAGAKDDFVDALALIGLGLALQVVPRKGRVRPKDYARGTLGYMKQQSRRDEKTRLTARNIQGW